MFLRNICPFLEEHLSLKTAGVLLAQKPTFQVTLAENYTLLSTQGRNVNFLYKQYSMLQLMDSSFSQ